MIFVDSEISKTEKCGSCRSKDKVVRVEIGNGNYISFFHLCGQCSKELHTKLEESKSTAEGAN